MREKISGIAWIVLLAIVIIGPFVFFLIFASKPGSIIELVEQHQEEIVSERGELRVSYECMEEIQKENGSTYYVDIENNLMQKTDGKDECLIQGVCSFLVDKQNIYYIKTSQKSQGVFCRRLGDKEETQVVSEDVSMFALGSGQNYACTDDDLVECKENGIYRMNLKTKTLEKVSNSCGVMLLNLEDDLYVVNSEFFYHKLKKCEWIK